MLQQQINYWTLREAMRHNRVGESIGWYEAKSGRMDSYTRRMDAKTNRLNYSVNVMNAETSRMNAYSNRIQAGAAVTQAGAAVRQAGAAERQAGAREREVSVIEEQSASKIFNNYMSPFGGAAGSVAGGVVNGTKGKAKGVAPVPTTKTEGQKLIDGLKKYAPSGAVSLGTVIDLRDSEKYVDSAMKRTETYLRTKDAINNYHSVW